MNNTKATIDFSTYSAADLLPIAKGIHDKMVAHAARFTAPTVAMATLDTQITSYETKLVARASNATTDQIAFNDARELLEESLGALGNYVNGVAKGDAGIVDESGFPAYNTQRPVDFSPPEAPQNLRLSQGTVSGTLVARYKPDRSSSTNEVQTNIGNANTEADWHQQGMYQGGKAELDGFTPGGLVWVRVRTVGLKGVMGAWSDPAQIRVL